MFDKSRGGGGGRQQEKAHASEEGEQKGAVEDDQGETYVPSGLVSSSFISLTFGVLKLIVHNAYL